MSLTKAQLERQDFVDNAVFELIQKLDPSGKGIQWNIEMIGNIRDEIQYWIVEYLGLSDKLLFYPFIKE